MKCGLGVFVEMLFRKIFMLLLMFSVRCFGLVVIVGSVSLFW